MTEWFNRTNNKQIMWAFLLVLALLCTSVTLAVLYAPSSSSSTDDRKAPLTAHFIYGLWDDTPMPKSYADNIEGWRALGWNIQIWDRAAVNALIQEHYPDMWDFYQNISQKGQKADWSRYFIIYQFGNFYFDADVKPFPQSDLLQRIKRPLQDFYAFIEVTMTEKQAKAVALKNPIRKGIPEIHGDRLANYAFGCPPKHPALKKVMDLAKQRCDENPVIKSDYEILHTTGPEAFTTALHGDKTIKRWKHTEWFVHTNSHAWIQKPKKIE